MGSGFKAFHAYTAAWVYMEGSWGVPMFKNRIISEGHNENESSNKTEIKDIINP